MERETIIWLSWKVGFFEIFHFRVLPLICRQSQSWGLKSNPFNFELFTFSFRVFRKHWSRHSFMEGDEASVLSAYLKICWIGSAMPAYFRSLSAKTAHALYKIMCRTWRAIQTLHSQGRDKFWYFKDPNWKPPYIIKKL